MNGLGLKRIPDIKNMNISQEEYEEKYDEYLRRVNKRIANEKLIIKRVKRTIIRDTDIDTDADIDDGDTDDLGVDNIMDTTIADDFIDDNDEYPLFLHSFKPNHTEFIRKRNKKRILRSFIRKNRETNHNYHINNQHIDMRNNNNNYINSNDLVYLRFQLSKEDLSSKIEESTLRLLIIKRKQNKNTDHMVDEMSNTDSVINLRIYQLIEPYGRVWLDTKRIQYTEGSRWIELDVSKAITSWSNGRRNLGFEIHCSNCANNNINIVHDGGTETNGSPVLNIIGRIMHREKRSKQHRHFVHSYGNINNNKQRRQPRKDDCIDENSKCCLHSLKVVFKDIEGYQFVLQPKSFEAGYCQGKCPLRYNPASNHAVLQSLIWKSDPMKAPRLCCAPSKLVNLEVLHLDENDSNRLKVSVWSDMRVLECACS